MATVARLEMDPALNDASEIVAVAWRPLAEVAGDPQVQEVVNALTRTDLHRRLFTNGARRGTCRR